MTGWKILNGTITDVDLANGAVTTAKIADNTVTGIKILNGTITAWDLANGAATTAKIADNAITGAKIVDGSITAADLAPGVGATRASVIGFVYIGGNARTVPLTAVNHDDGPLGTGYIKVGASSSDIVMLEGINFDDAADELVIMKSGLYSLSMHGQIKSGVAKDSLNTPIQYNATRLEVDVNRNGQRLRFLEANSDHNKAGEDHRTASVVFPLIAGDRVHLITGYEGPFVTAPVKIPGTIRDLWFTVALIHPTP